MASATPSRKIDVAVTLGGRATPKIGGANPRRPVELEDEEVPPRRRARLDWPRPWWQRGREEGEEVGG